MKIVIAADHQGFTCKQHIIAAPRFSAIEWIDVGTYSEERTDYPVYGHAALTLMQRDNIERVVLLCKSGIGMAIVANRYPSVYAAVAWSVDVARLARQDDNCNGIVIPTEYVTHTLAVEIIDTWLHTPFLGGRYAERIAMIDARGCGDQKK